MNLEKFKELETHELENTYGGFWQLFAAAMAWILPNALNVIAQSVATFKMATSDNGSVKTKDYESHWSENKEAAEKESKASRDIKQIVYAY